MSRKIFYSLFTCLLCLLPVLIQAQSLTRYEYWFDDNFSGRVSKSISGTDALVKLSIDTDQLDNGIHKFSFRAKQSDDMYSAITSSLFLKRPAAQNSVMEYWFDDKFDQRESMSISNTEDEQTFELDLRDNAKYPWGFHQLNMHITLEGGGESAVYSSPVLKLSAGKATQLEYWIDDDFAHVHTISGSLASDGQDYLFVNDLDLGDVSPGHHRLYCRTVSSSGKTASAVTMTPIIVKSRYNVNSADAKVTQYSLSVDNEAPVIAKLGSPDNDITFEQDFDVHDLTPGTHTLKAKFWNNFGACVGEESQFTVTVPETPTITLNATEAIGSVQLSFDVPRSVHRYALNRRDANGAKAVIYKCPENIAGGWFYTDTPSAGSYTYFIQGSYRDASGTSHLVSSNEVAVNVAEVQAPNGFGYITGIIWPKYGAANMHDIVYSDGWETTITDKYFERQQIPVGTTLTISVRGNSLEEFETATVTIKAGENHVSLKDLNNVAFESKPNYNNHDLDFCSDLDWVGNNYQFSVKNVTRNTWSGYVRLRIITKDKALKEKLKAEEEGGDGETTDPSIEEDYGEITPGLRAEDNYVYVYSTEIKNLQSGESTMVSLSLDDVFAPDKNDWYYIYFESVGKWNIDPKGSEKVKLIGIDHDYSVTENPVLRQISKKDLKLAVAKELMQDAEYGANIILACCSKLNQLNGIIGNMGDVGWVELSKKYKEKYPIDLNDLNQYIDEAIETESAAKFKEDLMMQAFLFDVFGYNALEFANTFREKVANDIFKYSKGVDEYLGGAMKVLKYIRDYRTWEKMDDYEQYFYCADAILDAADRYTNTPICEMLKVYTKIGKSLIQKALEYGATLYDNYAGSMLKDNAASPSDRKDYNRNIDFKIMVRTNSMMNFFHDIYFNFEENGTSPIRDVVVKAHNIPGRPEAIATFYFDLVPVSDGVMLKQTSTHDESLLDDQKPIDRMWMEIKWKNGRMTKVPLRDDIDGVVFNQATLGQQTHLYTVYLQSETTTFDNMADEIEIKE